MSEFTPGPWLRDEYGNVVAGSGDRVAFRSVTTVCSGTDERISEAEANTTLIASAPDLLEALEMIVAEADSYTAMTGKPVYNWLDQARAAIAKARGTPC
ncbi:hypothetical protein [Stutzerimonas stutzeri]|uniref:Uncharacterized protein n=1 Tax=Stutzerimonas stutzeri KOS6 TaxID=1218352 RepID=A0A061JJU9_STUST|nr:hypothetical protein [Stutzerimonas stutzeri]EWC39591.1 hypothetical protein B597_019565 [Stutzerimonas stutzeri KOS6]